MRQQDVKVGMRVTPFQKYNYPLEESVEWTNTQKRHRNFLYVIGWRQHIRRWSLSARKNSSTGDWFRAKDFRPYVPKAKK